MPRVTVKRMDYKKKDLYLYLTGEMKFRKISQGSMTEQLNVTTQQAVSKKLKNATLTYEDLVKLFDRLQTPDEKIVELMRFRK